MQRIHAAKILGIAVLALALSGCAERTMADPPVIPHVAAPFERGLASWYGHRFNGRRTTSGERYDMHKLTAAHPTLPMGTRVDVTNLDNGRSVRVRINDRGPFEPGRVIDLSYAAARRIRAARPGVVPVEVRLVVPPTTERVASASSSG